MMNYNFEERIINYEETNQIQKIIDELFIENFFLVKHSSTKKQLHFKKLKSTPKTIIFGDP